MDSLFSYLIKSDFVRAQVLAVVRHVVTAAGAALVAKGYADGAISEDMVGLATAVAGFWLANLDVHKVDAKINTALSTPYPALNTQAEQNQAEIEETKRLNNSMHGIGK